MAEVTDPKLLAQLNQSLPQSSNVEPREVTDPQLLARLNQSLLSSQPSSGPIPENLPAPGQQPEQPSAPQTDSVGLPTQAASLQNIQKINAVGGGAQETLANSVKYGGGLVGDVLGTLNTKAGDAITQGSENLSQKLMPPEFVQQAQQAHPYLSAAGNAIGGTMAMGATGLAAGAALPEATADYAANAVIGAATSGHGLTNRLVGAAAGATITGVAKGIGYGINKASQAMGVPEKLNAIVNEANEYLKGQTSDQAAQASISNMWNIATRVRESLYGDFKNTAGDVDVKTLANQAAQGIKDLEDVMTPGQKGAFKTIQNQAASVKNLNDLHELDKSINKMKSLFLKSGTAPDVGEAFNALKDTSSSLLDSNAESLGAGDALQLAKKFNKDVIVPLQDFGADKVARGEVSTDGFLSKFIKSPTNQNPSGSPEALGNLLNAMDDNGGKIVEANLVNKVAQAARVGADGFDPTKGIKVIDDNLKLYGDKLRPSTVDTLNGMKKVLQQGVLNPSTAQKGASSLGKHLVLDTVGAGIGAGYGYNKGGIGGALSGAAAGIGATEGLIKLLGTSIGHSILEFIGSNPNGTALAKHLVTQSGSALSGKVIKQISGQ